MQSQAFPVQVPEQFASVYGLGTPNTVYLPGQSNRWVGAILGAFLMIGGGLTVLYGIYDAYVKVEKYGPVIFTKALWTPLAIGVVLGLLGFLAALNAFFNWNKAVVVYEKGLAYNDNRGVQIWGWHEVDRLMVAITKHYYNGIYTGTTYLYTLQKADGSKLKLDNKFSKIELLGRAISQNVAPHQYQKLVTAVKAGQTVALGPIAINKDGIAIGKKTYSWNEIEQVGIQQGFVSIKKKGGGWFSGASASAASIPNLDALLAVIDQIVGVKSGR